MKQIEEIYWLRFYGCLAVFTFHLIDRIERNYLEHMVLDLAYIPTVVGTPIFIFISIFLFSARYGDATPHHFLARRLKYVMIPYVVYGLIYSLAEYVRLWLSDEPVALVPHLVEYLVFAGWRLLPGGGHAVLRAVLVLQPLSPLALAASGALAGGRVIDQYRLVGFLSLA